MNNTEITSIYAVTNAACDVGLIEDIAAIERLLQPFDPWSEQAITGLLDQDVNECWAIRNSKELADETIEGQGRVIAYCILSKVFEVAEVLRIATHPAFQRQGYAQWLLKQIIAHMPNKGLQRILLEVREDNSEAIMLYQKIGFKVIHKREGYYSSMQKTGVNQRVAALIMEFVM